MSKVSKLFFLVLLCSSCTKTEYVDVDVAPKLEITVIDTSINPFEGVAVRLFRLEDDFLGSENVIKTLTTDENGKVLFEDLSESIYYFYASKGDQDNYYEVVTFEIPLEMNEVRAITTIIR